MKTVVDKGNDFITAKWLESVCDRYMPRFDEETINIRKSLHDKGLFTGRGSVELDRVAVFEIEPEADDGGYTHLRVSVPQGDHSDEVSDVEIETRASRNSKAERTGIGLYKFRNDIMALVEVLVRGHSGCQPSGCMIESQLKES